MLFAAIAMLNDVAHLAVRIGENSAIAGWVGQTRRQQRDIGTTAAVSFHEGIDRCGPQERHITKDVPSKALSIGRARQMTKDNWANRST